MFPPTKICVFCEFLEGYPRCRGAWEIFGSWMFCLYLCELIMQIITIMSAQNVYETILASDRTVFTLPLLMTLSGNYDRVALVRSLYYYRKRGLIDSPRSGIYVKKGYSNKELACALYNPSYVSLTTVLSEAGVIFQYSDKVTVVSSLSRTISVDGRVYEYRKINPFLWGGMAGIREENGYFIATPERAVLDTMYLYPDIGYFDNIRGLDFDLIRNLAPDYNNAAFLKRVQKWIQISISSL